MPHQSPHRPRRRLRRGAALATVVLVLGAPAVGAAAERPVPTAGIRSSASPPEATRSGWRWPLASFRLERAFVAPPHPYGPGHRGIDLRALGNPDVRAPASGVIAFSGPVAGRGVVTIDHGDGLVTTLEPVASPAATGATVRRGDVVGTVATGGHAATGSLHLGVRLDGAYINPLLLLGEVPRAVLLPCC